MTKAETVSFARLGSAFPLPFESLYEMYRTPVYRFARSLAENPEEAEDLFQETWMRAARAFGRKPQAGDLRAWLFTITANLHKDSLRRKRVRRLFWLEKTRPRDSRPTRASPGRDGEETSVPDAAARTEFRMCLRRALAKLKAGERRVFVLKEIEGFKHGEIAAILGVPENTVRTRLHRAVKRLQEELRKMGVASPGAVVPGKAGKLGDGHSGIGIPAVRPAGDAVQNPRRKTIRSGKEEGMP